MPPLEISARSWMVHDHPLPLYQMVGQGMEARQPTERASDVSGWTIEQVAAMIKRICQSQS